MSNLRWTHFNQNFNARGKRSRNCVFIPLGMAKTAWWIIFVVLNIFVITSLQNDTHIDWLAETLLKLSTKNNTEVLPIIKYTCAVFIDNFRNISTNYPYRYQFLGKVMTDVQSIKEKIPWDSQGNEKMQFLFLLLLVLTFWSEMKILFPRNAKQKTVWNNLACRVWVTRPRSWVVNPIEEFMPWSNPYKWMFNFWPLFQIRRLITHPRCKIISNGFFVLHSSEVIFSFLIKKSRLKAIEIEIAFFFHSLENPKGRTLDHFFYASHICHNFPYKTIPISMS